MRIAIDSGGTFTDCVFLREGKLHILKVPSRPGAPADAIVEAVQLARQSAGGGGHRDEALDLVCGTTVGTNALLERRGGRVALLTTVGFEDVLEIGRQARPKLYDLFVQKAEPLVPRERRIGVRERLAADGSVVQPLSSKEIARVLQKVRACKAQSVAVCFLFSFRNPEHERRLAQKLRAAGYAVSVSQEILPEYREFERTSTTVTNAYLAPVMSSYLRETGAKIEKIAVGLSTGKRQSAKRSKSAGTFSRVRIMQSNGGIISAERAAREPVRTILSGPAGGVMGAAYAARLAGLKQCISFDMGGTSTDVALLTNAGDEESLRVTNESIVAGLPVAVGMLEINTVGAGGGSIARFDTGGSLRVGPESAGAEPGPICYGRGTRTTVTDAHAVLGHLGDGGLLNGNFSLDIPRARAAMQAEIGTSRAAFRSVEQFARGIVAVANAVMEKAIRVISVERGHDPRDYSLVAFGGAGGLHACDLADALEMRNVLIPIFPGGLSALGILRADVVQEFSRTVLLPAKARVADRNRWKSAARELQRHARESLRNEGFTGKTMRLHHSLDMRYAGQAYNLNISAAGDVLGNFHRAHQQRYGYHDVAKPVEIVNVRCRAVGVTQKQPPARIQAVGTRSALRPSQSSRLLFEKKGQTTHFYRREDLLAGQVVTGPAVITEYSATTLLPPHWKGRVDAYGQLLLDRER